MRHLAILLLLLLPIGGNCGAPPTRLDSLLAQMQKMREDTNGAKLLWEISFEYRSINPAEGLKYAAKTLSLSRKLGWRQGEANAFNARGNNYMYKGSYAEALEAFFRSLSINEALGNNGAIATVSGNIATVYYRLKDYTRSLEYGRKRCRWSHQTK